MFSRIRIALGVAFLVSLVIILPAFAGGWAVITLDALPAGVAAGEALTVGFTVLQHGQTPMSGLTPTITATLDQDEQFVVSAEPEGRPGHYTATLIFPKEGDWNWSIQAFTMDQPMPFLSVAASHTASVSQPLKTEPAAPAVSPWLILRTLAVGIGLIGLVLAFRRKSRLAISLTGLCLLAGFALFITGAGTASGLEAQGEVSEAPEDSSLSQVELGRQLFIAKGCVTCHRNSRIPHNMTRSTLDIGTDLSNFSASPEVLFMRLKDPSSVKSDTQMPNLGLTKEEIEALIAFINSE